MEVKETAKGVYSATSDETAEKVLQSIAEYHGIDKAAALGKILARGIKRYAGRKLKSIEGRSEKKKSGGKK